MRKGPCRGPRESSHRSKACKCCAPGPGVRGQGGRAPRGAPRSSTCPYRTTQSAAWCDLIPLGQGSFRTPSPLWGCEGDMWFPPKPELGPAAAGTAPPPYPTRGSGAGASCRVGSGPRLPKDTKLPHGGPFRLQTGGHSRDQADRSPLSASSPAAPAPNWAPAGPGPTSPLCPPAVTSGPINPAAPARPPLAEPGIMGH